MAIRLRVREALLFAINKAPSQNHEAGYGLAGKDGWVVGVNELRISLDIAIPGSR
jgi:hypothetical protein